MHRVYKPAGRAPPAPPSSSSGDARLGAHGYIREGFLPNVLIEKTGLGHWDTWGFQLRLCSNYVTLGKDHCPLGLRLPICLEQAGLWPTPTLGLCKRGTLAMRSPGRR